MSRRNPTPREARIRLWQGPRAKCGRLRGRRRDGQCVTPRIRTTARCIRLGARPTTSFESADATGLPRAARTVYGKIRERGNVPPFPTNRATNGSRGVPGGRRRGDGVHAGIRARGGLLPSGSDAGTNGPADGGRERRIGVEQYRWLPGSRSLAGRPSVENSKAGRGASPDRRLRLRPGR